MSQRFFFNPIRHTSLGLAVLGCRWSAWQLRSSCPLFIMVAQGLLAPPVPRELAIEAKITENMTTTIDQLKEIGDKSEFVCPDCGGGLYAIRNDPTHRYRCHTGHVYTEQLLQDIQGLHLEESVWVSVRMLEERYNLLLLMADHAADAGQATVANGKAATSRRYAKTY